MGPASIRGPFPGVFIISDSSIMGSVVFLLMETALQLLGFT